MRYSYNKDYFDYQFQRNKLRKLMRRLYLNHILKYVKGKAIDFGCGIGELLVKLEEGSIGFDINQKAVEYCNKINLNAKYYNAKEDRYKLKNCKIGEYKTLIMNHVCEHIENADTVLRTILKSCRRLGIVRIIIVVPGPKGFIYDKSHKTFIDRMFFENNNLYTVERYNIGKETYFPIPFSWAGHFFTHNELMIIYE